MTPQQKREIKKLARKFVDSLTTREYLLRFKLSQLNRKSGWNKLVALNAGPIEGFAGGEQSLCIESIWKKQESVLDELKEILGHDSLETKEAAMELMTEVNGIFEHEPVVEIGELKSRGLGGSPLR